MAYAILRTAKLSTLGQVATSAQHTFREREVNNADAVNTRSNDIDGATSSHALMKAVKARLSLVETQAVTKPVLCIEYMITASPDAFLRHSGHLADSSPYFEDARQWLYQRHGQDNVVSCTVHQDERTPHLVAYVVPLVERQGKSRQRSVIVGKDVDGKPIRELRTFAEKGSVSLSAKEFLGGREKLRAMQTDFAETVGSKYGLERGKERSTAKHQTVRAFYAAIEKPVVNKITLTPESLRPRLVRKGFITSDYESEQGVADRLNKTVETAFGPAVQLAKIVEINQHRAKSLEVTRRNEQNRLKKLQEQVEQLKQNSKELIHIIAQGGDPLLQFQKAFRENLAKTAKNEQKKEQGQDKGWSR